MFKRCLESILPQHLPEIRDADSGVIIRECMKIILQDIWKSIAESWDHLL